jgi:uncharacterized repeat protein (TIGR02543 family)
VKTSLTGQIQPGKTDTLTATAQNGYSFTGWSGDTTTTDPVLILKNISKDWVLQANFTPKAGTNLIRSGDFSDNTLWGFYAATGNTAEVKYSNGQADVTITKADTLNYSIQLTQGDIKLDSGVTYTITFDAWSSAERTLFVGLSTAGTWHYQGGGEVTLSDTKKNFKIEIQPDSSTTAGILQFNCGKFTLPIHIDNVAMVKKSATSVRAAMKSTMSGASFIKTGNMIVWNAQSANAEASLMDLSGKIVQHATMKNAVSLANVPEGIYLFVIKGNGLYQTFKIVK